MLIIPSLQNVVDYTWELNKMPLVRLKLKNPKVLKQNGTLSFLMEPHPSYNKWGIRHIKWTQMKRKH